MKFRLVLILTGLVITATGCSISQTIEPAHIPNSASICIVENKAVREGFLSELKSVLNSKEIPYTVLSESSETCEWTLHYTARWSWDLALYMSYAELKVYQNGILEGEAVYDATKGGGRMDKFIDAEPKIRELVDELLKKQLSYFYTLPNLG